MVLLPSAVGWLAAVLPRPLDTYAAPSPDGLLATLVARARAEPFNLVATAIFAAAILHTFFTPKIRRWAAQAEARHAEGGPRLVQHESGE